MAGPNIYGDWGHPAETAEAISKSDTVNFTGGLSRWLYVGGAGIVVAVFDDDSTATFAAVPAGTLLPIRIKRVNSTTTSATSMVALF
jgi:hypothetical protein